MKEIKQIKVYYCDYCNSPVLLEEGEKNLHCPNCHNTVKYISTDIRPVYPEERLMLEASLGEPLKYIQNNVWSIQGSRYIVDGNILDIEIKKIVSSDTKKVIKIIEDFNSKNTYQYFNKYIKVFNKINKKRLDIITDEAIEYIKKSSEKYDINDMFVSFSGGKDSTVVSHLVIRALATNDILHIFGDTTLEFKETYKYIKEFKRKNPNIIVRTVKNKEKDFEDLTINTFGPPSRLMRWCCTIFKTGPISKKLDALFKDKKSILTFYGIRKSESVARSKYERDYDSPKILKQKVRGPIFFWKDAEVWLYILSNNVLINNAYRQGYRRVGCWCCPNSSDWSEYMNKIYEAERFEKWQSILVDFATKIGKPDPEIYASEGWWKARQGGNGLNVENTKISSEVCTTQHNAYKYKLKRPITEELYELFKPFGVIDKESGRKAINEVIVRKKNSLEPILSIQGILKDTDLKIVILDDYKQKITKQREECQITKYQLCMGCLACESVCKFDAIKIKNGKYIINEEKCVSCKECITHFNGGCYVRKVLYTKNV